MIKHKGSVSENQLLSIFRRINRKADACITLEEFVTFLCPLEMNHEKVLKKLSPSSLEARESAKKPLISPVVRHLENERRSKSPLLKDISLLSVKNLQKEVKSFSKRKLSPVRVSANKSKGQSPHSRSPIKPTPTISSRRENSSKTLKTSKTLQTKIQGYTPISRSLLDRRQIFRTEAEEQNEKTNLGFGSARKSSKSPEYSSAKKSDQRVPSTGQRSTSRKNLTIGKYLDQRRAEFKTQRSDSKPKTPVEATPIYTKTFDAPKIREALTEPTAKQVSRSLKYDDLSSSKLVKPIEGRIVEHDPREHREEKNLNSKNSSGKKENSLEKRRDLVKKSAHIKESNIGTQKGSDLKSSRAFQDSNSGPSETSSHIFSEKPRERERLSRSEVETQHGVSPSIIQLTPTHLADSLEMSNTSPSRSRILMREKYSRSPITSITKKSEDGHLVPGYQTGHSELSFSDRKNDEVMAETPKFDSGVHQSDTGARPTKNSEPLNHGVPKPSDIEKLCIIFKKIIVFYERIEELKYQIHNEKDFSLTNHYYSFDFENKGYLTLAEFTQLFNSFGINIGRGEIVEYLKLILKKSSIRPESRLTETDLAKCFSPLNTEGKLLLYSSTSSSQQGQPKFEVKPHIGAKLDEIVQLQIKLHCELIKEIKPIDPSVLPRMFKILSEQGSVATWAQITGFLKANEVKFFENDAIFIFREFNCRQPREMLENEFLSLFRLYSTAGL